MSVDLKRLIRDHLAESSEADPCVIARRLVTRIPDEDLREALAEALRDRVREQLRQMRGNYDPEANRESRPGRAWTEAVRDVLRHRVYTGSEWKLLGDCSADDLDGVANEYARRARENAALEARYRWWSEQMRQRGVDTLRELQHDDLAVAA